MKVYSIADFIISPLGIGTDENFSQLKQTETAIARRSDNNIPQENFYAAAMEANKIVDYFTPQDLQNYTFLELQFILTIQKLLKASSIEDYARLLLIISTTKGNINLLDDADQNFPEERLYLPIMASVINDFFHFPNEPIIVSNACISGVSAILTGKKLIENGNYDHVLIVGGDLFSHFVFAGFASFKALSEDICKPYDKQRDGINLGEAIAGMLLSNDKEIAQNQFSVCEIAGGGQSNDANHISGPSREGVGLTLSIKKALNESKIVASNIDFINAHGTATIYNDEMEAIAFSKTELGKVPLNSLKGYFGHTLGTAGILESVITIRQMNHNFLLKSFGFEELGTTKEINVLKNNSENDVQYALKTASGFGGGNAAIVFKKV